MSAPCGAPTLRRCAAPVPAGARLPVRGCPCAAVGARLLVRGLTRPGASP